MKPLSYVIIICIGIYGNLIAGSVDSSARVTGSDEELILDDGPSTLVPGPSPKNSASSAQDVIAPAVTPAGDTSGKKQPSAAPQPENKAAAQGQSIAPKAARSEPKVKDTSKKIVDEELILDGGEEDLLGQTPKSAAKTTDPVPGGAVVKAPDSTAIKSSTDSAGTAAQNLNPSAVTLPPGLAGKPPVPKVAAKIENARSINFAANLKEYRSPKLAMLMSLCVPGSGQVYAKANWFAAGFLLVEAVIVGTGLAYSSKSKAQKAKAHKFADTAYGADKFKTYTESLKSNLNAGNGDSIATEIYNSIFFDSSDVQFLNEAYKEPGKRSDNFYNDIASETSPFLRGWKDVKPAFEGSKGFGTLDAPYTLYSDLPDSSYLVYRYGDKANASFGFSDYQKHYISILDESRRLANNSRTAFLTLVINHLASAVMAGIEAKNHNDALLGRETFWRHVDIEQQFVNTGSETVAGYSIGVRF